MFFFLPAVFNKNFIEVNFEEGNETREIWSGLSEIGEWSKNSGFLFIPLFTREREIAVKIFDKRAIFFVQEWIFQPLFCFKLGLFLKQF